MGKKKKGLKEPRVRLFADSFPDDVSDVTNKFLTTMEKGKAKTNCGTEKRKAESDTINKSVSSFAENTGLNDEQKQHHDVELTAEGIAKNTVETLGSFRVTMDDVIEKSVSTHKDIVAMVDELDKALFREENFETSVLGYRLPRSKILSRNVDILTENQSSAHVIGVLSNDAACTPETNVCVLDRSDMNETSVYNGVGNLKHWKGVFSWRHDFDKVDDEIAKKYQDVLKEIRIARIVTLASALKVQNSHATLLIQNAALLNKPGPGFEEKFHDTIKNIIFDEELFFSTLQDISKEDTLKKVPDSLQPPNHRMVTLDKPIVKPVLIKETYRECCRHLPLWFLQMFHYGHVRIHLQPTFPCSGGEECREYEDLQHAFFMIELSNKSLQMAIHCGTNMHYEETEVDVEERISFPECNRPRDSWPGCFRQIGNEEWRQCCRYRAFCKNNRITRRRVELLGSYKQADVNYLLGKHPVVGFEKGFVIVFLKGSDGTVSGTYRREMSSVPDKFLTWKFNSPILDIQISDLGIDKR